MFTIRGFFEERQCQDKKYEKFWWCAAFVVNKIPGRTGNY
jgi:hypothetical protein